MLGDKIMALPHELLILGAAVKTGLVEALRKSTTCDACWSIRAMAVPGP